MAETSIEVMPNSQTSAPIPGEKAAELKGGYMNQPPSGARPISMAMITAVPPKM
jgi:hypothetical protein